jgi:hypothetical protein
MQDNRQQDEIQMLRDSNAALRVCRDMVQSLVKKTVFDSHLHSGLVIEPLSQFEVLVAQFLWFSGVYSGPLTDKTRNFSSRHILHRSCNGGSGVLLYPFMQFRAFNIDYVLSAYASPEGITMWSFLLEEYKADLPHGVWSSDIRNGFDSRSGGPSVEVLSETVNRLQFTELRHDAHVVFNDRTGQKARCAGAAKLFVDHFKEQHTAEISAHSAAYYAYTDFNAPRPAPSVTITEMHPDGKFLYSDEAEFNYESDGLGLELEILRS